MTSGLILADLQGSPYIGVFAAANDHVVLLPPSAPGSLVHELSQALEAKPHVMTIGGSTVLGAVVAMNSRGAIVADIATEDECGQLRALGLRVAVLEGKLNAAGNNVLCNDRGCVVHPGCTMGQIDAIGEALGLERVETGTVAGLGTVGSAAVATNRGVLCHPRLAPREKEHLEDVLGVPAAIGTVNHGMPYIGAGLVANQRGAGIGRTTTGPEMNRIEDALSYL